MKLLFLGLWLSLVVASVLAVPILKLLSLLKSKQTVSQFVPEHQKKQGTPTMGGLIILAGALSGLVGLGVSGVSSAWAYLLLLLGFALIGFVDDYVVPKLMKSKRGLGWKQKLAMQVLLAAGVLYAEGIKQPLPIALGVFLILFFSNAYNFADGLDALAGSLGLFLFLGIAAIGLLVGNQPVPAVCLCLVGGFVPFLMLNAPPAKVFMGDVGSLPIGASIGLMYMDLGARSTEPTTLFPALAVLSVMMAAELIPVPIQIFSVKLFGKRIPFKTPIHHGFEARGWPETRIVWRFAMVQLVCSAVAITIVGLAQ
jgi:phospho-N-acetylmuramoyl-pentapeptide-transferase